MIVHVEIADDGIAERALRENRVEHELRTLAARIVEPHGKLAPDHLLFLDVFVLGQRGILHRIRQDLHRFGRAVRRNVNPIHRPVKTGVGIDVAAAILHLLGNLAAFAFLCALEKHVLENVRKAGAQPFALLDTAGPAPGLHAGHGCAAIFLHNDGEAVLQGENLRLAFGKNRGVVRSTGVFRGRGGNHHKGEENEKKRLHASLPTMPGPVSLKLRGSGWKGCTKASGKS